VASVVLHAARGYRLLAAMWIRSSMIYRTSFIMMTLGQFFITLLDFAAIVIMFGNIDRLGGFGLAQVAFLYGVSGFGLGGADLIVGNVERLGQRIRDGTLDAMLIRPLPALVQVCADDFQLRRVGRLAQSSGVLAYGIAASDIAWTWDRAVLMIVMLISGVAIFCSVFILFACYQFLAQEAAEMANAFTYGGNTLTQYPLTIFPTEVIRGVTFIVPLAFVNWYPSLRILDRPDPLGLPEVVQFASPLVAVVLCLVAGAVWRLGLRSYRSTGS
jgi:viologen exporter family transport system permease protein